MTIRVVIADDHPLLRSGLRALLSSVEEVELVGEARTGQEALQLVTELGPDVVLMDLDMPVMGGTEATRAIAALPPPRPAVLVLTMDAGDEALAGAVQAGASGFLLKGADAEDVLRGLEAVARGESWFGAGVGERLGRALASRPGRGKAGFEGLTPREIDVLELLATGASNGSIARELGLSTKTVQNHVSNLLTKLALPDRTAAALAGRDAGLGRSSR